MVSTFTEKAQNTFMIKAKQHNLPPKRIQSDL